MPEKPTVSIIISAYNRPKVVIYAIKSVLDSDFDDWELIVVGDGCNTETEAAIRAFTDPRIRFHNLAQNTGHQSAPHNKGVEMARGTYVFFLNQDDMYFPDHIANRVAFMDKTGADISWSPILLLQHSGTDSGPIDADHDRLYLDGAVADGKFHPNCFVISSCWAVRREICAAVGPWLPINETRLSPSQEWLFRAHEQGRKMVYHRHVSVMCIHSGVRRYSYVNPESPEHERAWSWIEGGTEARAQLLDCVAIQMAGHLFDAQRALEKHRRPVLAGAQALSRKLGIHPDSVRRFFDGMKRGAWVDDHTKFTKSAPPTLGLDQTLSFSNSNTGDASDTGDMIGRGWHDREPSGRWSSQESAEINFSVTGENHVLAVSGHTLRPGDTVEFLVNRTPVLVEPFNDHEQVFLVPIAASGFTLLTIKVKNPQSPQDLGLSEDNRVLGFHLSAIRLTVPSAARLA